MVNISSSKFEKVSKSFLSKKYNKEKEGNITTKTKIRAGVLAQIISIKVLSQN
jgi:hypothetical protein